MPKALSVLALLVLSGSRAVGAAGAVQTQFVVVAAHLPAAGGTNWASDLRIYNPTGTAATAGLTFLPDGSDNSSAPEVSVTIGAGQALLLADVVLTTFGAQSSGAIQIRSNDALVVSSSTYLSTPSPFPGTTVPRKENFQSTAVDETEWSSPAKRILFVSNRFRDVEAGRSVPDSTTNVGFLNPGSDAVNVILDLFDQQASTHLGGMMISLPSKGFAQIVDVFAAFGAMDARTENATLSIASYLARDIAPEPAPVLAYAVRQTATEDECGGFEKQADFLAAQRIP